MRQRHWRKKFSYSLEDNERDAPDGICLDQHFATACVWDNNDASVETIDGKETLHATVGHTYQNIDENYQNDTTVLSLEKLETEGNLLAVNGKSHHLDRK